MPHWCQKSDKRESVRPGLGGQSTAFVLQMSRRGPRKRHANPGGPPLSAPVYGAPGVVFFVSSFVVTVPSEFSVTVLSFVLTVPSLLVELFSVFETVRPHPIISKGSGRARTADNNRRVWRFMQQSTCRPADCIWGMYPRQGSAAGGKPFFGLDRFRVMVDATGLTHSRVSAQAGCCLVVVPSTLRKDV